MMNNFKLRTAASIYQLPLPLVLLAGYLLASPMLAQAACVDNGDNTFTCSGDSSNVNTFFGPPSNFPANNGSGDKTLILNNAAGPVSLTNQTTDTTLITVPGYTINVFGFDMPPEYGAIIRNTILGVGGGSTITTNGSNPAVINNIGGVIELSTSRYDTATDNFQNRTFDPSGWLYDETTRSLTNNGVEVGYAAAITTSSTTQSLTINNRSVNDSTIDPTVANAFVLGEIRGSGDLSAAIYTNVPILTINNGGNTGTGQDSGIIQKIATYGGGSFTPPPVLDGSGTQQATNVTAGQTIINNINGSSINQLFVVDKNPFLTEAQTLSGLALTTTQADVGPRNSIINNNNGSAISNLSLGSGSHLINISDNSRIDNINVDQRDTAVTQVIGGVEIPQYLVHGDRRFTLNLVSSQVAQSTVQNVVINDVAGAVNNVNLSGFLSTFYGNFTANGLGSNTLNINCADPTAIDSFFRVRSQCFSNVVVSGFNDINIEAKSIDLVTSLGVTGSINLNAGRVVLPFSSSQLTATNIIVGNSTLLTGNIFQRDITNGQSTADSIGSITGNLINNGTVNVGSTVLNVNGNASFNAGSNLIAGVGLTGNGQVLTTGTATFDSNALLTPYIKADVRVTNGQSFVVATNATGLPTIVNNTGFLQWVASEATGDLVLTADVGVPSFLGSRVSQSGRNAVEQVFSYTGTDPLRVELQTYLIQLRDINVSRASERLRPEINDGAIRMVLGNTDKMFSIVGNRTLDSYLSPRKLGGGSASYGAEPIRVASNSPSLTGIVGGSNLPASSGIWVQGFGDRGSQDSQGGLGGYNSSAAGMAAGIDKTIDDAGDITLGAMFGYARGNVSNIGDTINNRTDINSFLGAVYGLWAMDNWYLSGAVGLGRNTYESQRHLGQFNAEGRHDSMQFSARVEAGLPVFVNQNITLVPVMSLDYSHIKESGYTENGQVSRATTVTPGLPPVYSNFDSPINLQIQGRNFDSVRGGLGGKAIYTLQQPGWAAELELHGMYRHEFGDIAQNSTARFTQFGGDFSSPGLKPERNGYLVGGSVRLSGDDDNDQLTFLASYDADIREKYLGQIMSLNLRWDFDGAQRYLRGANARKAADAAANASLRNVAANPNDIAAMQHALQANQYDTSIALPVIDQQKEKAVDDAIKTWASALSNKSLDIYFNSYAANFATPDGSTRQQWERKRKAEISKEANPAIKISDLTIAPQGDHASAMFTQTVSSGNEQEAVQKIVDLENKNGRWLIVREASLAMTE